MHNNQQPRLDTLGRYRMRKPRTSLAISPSIHEAIKAYAVGRNLRLEDATERLIRIALLVELGERE